MNRPSAQNEKNDTRKTGQNILYFDTFKTLLGMSVQQNGSARSFQLFKGNLVDYIEFVDFLFLFFHSFAMIYFIMV